MLQKDVSALRIGFRETSFDIPVSACGDEQIACLEISISAPGYLGRKWLAVMPGEIDWVEIEPIG